MASPTPWTCVWGSSGSWWWTGGPGMLHSMRLQRARHNWETELNWTGSPEGPEDSPSGEPVQFSSVTQSCPTLWDPMNHNKPGLPGIPSPTPEVHPNPCPSSWWCHPIISSSVDFQLIFTLFCMLILCILAEMKPNFLWIVSIYLSFSEDSRLWYKEIYFTDSLFRSLTNMYVWSACYRQGIILVY